MTGMTGKHLDRKLFELTDVQGHESCLILTHIMSYKQHLMSLITMLGQDFIEFLKGAGRLDEVTQ